MESVKNPITIVIVDDHPVVRAGLRQVLSTAPDIQVTGEGESGEQALQLIEEHHPDVLVLDVNLPGLNGLEVTRRLRSQGDPTAILILTIHDDNATIFGLLECGATGYVLKDEALETLASAVRAAAQHQPWLSPAIAQRLLQRSLPQSFPNPAKSPVGDGCRESLTQREMEVLRLLAEGLDNTAIARRLVITTRTVQNHVSNLYSKLGTSSRTEAALYAIRHSLVQVTPADGTPDEH